MNPPERFPPDDPREWLNRARSSLAIAKSRIPDVYLEDLCFKARQAAEKAIKAVMIKRGVDFPYMYMTLPDCLPCSKKRTNRSQTSSDRPESSLDSPLSLAIR